MKKFIVTSIVSLALVCALGFGFIPSMDQSAACADCDSDNLPGIKKAFLAFADECTKLVADGKEQPKKCFVANIYSKLLPIMKSLGKDNRFGPGDRILLVGETQVGNLVAGANREFQTAAPLDKDSLKIEVNKTDGGNGALIKICSVDEAGTVKRVGTINFAENGDTGTNEATITGVQGKIIRIEVASFGGVAKKFKYTLKTL